MSKIELTISPNYVPDWTIVDAVRELFQNAIDQEKQHPDNTMGWEYDEENEKLYITNKSSMLTANSLLLGSTSKAGDASTIGQFGEGYKIATLVLLRNDKQITFYNYGAKEIWRPRFVNSRRFGTKILTFFIEKSNMFKTLNGAHLTIEISGITPDEFYDEIAPSNLYIWRDLKGLEVIEETKFGNVINMPGKVFVNGLFVCEYEPYKYGYDFKPQHIKLDRDRKMVSDFDLRWLASKLWQSTKSDKVIKLLEEGAADVAYMNDVWHGELDYWRNIAAENFKNVYGPEAIPVTTQEELDTLPKGYRGVVVPESYKGLVRSRISWPVVHDDDEDDPKSRLQKLFDKLVMEYSIDNEYVEEFNEIMEDL